MTIRKQTIARLAVVLVGAMTLGVAVSPLAGASSQSKAVPPHPDTVTLADLTPSAPFAAQYAAFGKTGAMKAIEKQFNTTIHVTDFGTAQDATNAMLGGSADMSMGSLPAYGIVKAAGKEVTVTFAPFIGGGGVLIGAKKYEQTRGTDLSKFDGSTFGFTRIGSSSQILTKIAVERAGVTFSKQAQIAFGAPAAGLGVLQTCRADVIATDPTSAGQAIDAGAAYLILNFNDPKTAYPVIGAQLGTVYGFNTSFVTKYPELTKALTQALKKGLDAVKKVASSPAKVLKLFPADIQTVLKPGFATAWKLSAPGVLATDGTMGGRALTDTLTFNSGAGLITPAGLAAVPKIIDNSFLTGAKTTATS